MRVVFLDYDGVLHPLGLQLVESATTEKPRARPVAVDFFCWVPLLAELLANHPDVRLASHTSWRENHTDEALGAYLGELTPRYIGKTIDGDKLASIDHMLAAHPEITNYRILDDVPMTEPCDDPDEAYSREEFILCDWQTGISAPDVQQQLQRWLQATQLPRPALSLP